jgi:hypothetical protein
MITCSSSFKRFLDDSPSEIAQYLNTALIHLQTPNHPASNAKIYQEMITDKEINYITFRRDGNISYLPAGKTHLITEGGEWAQEGRQVGKAAKVIRKLFTEKGLKLWKDSQFEDFANKYKAAFGSDSMKFELLPATEIPRVYDAVTEGINSCMCGAGKGGKLEIYTECPNLRILALWGKEGKLAGRCLVWDIELDGGKKITLADRFYVSRDFQFELFKEYCEEQGFYRKEDYQGRGNKTSFVTPGGKRLAKTLKVLTNTNFDKYPYIDTFSFGGEGYLTNNEMPGNKYVYTQTDGGRGGGRRTDRPYLVRDQITNRDIDHREAIILGAGLHAGCRTHRTNAVEIQGYYYWKDPSNYGIKQTYPTGNYVLTDDAVYSEYAKVWLQKQLAMWSSHMNSFLYQPEAIRVGMKWYHINEIGKTLTRDSTGKIVPVQIEIPELA